MPQDVAMIRAAACRRCSRTRARLVRGACATAICAAFEAIEDEQDGPLADRRRPVRAHALGRARPRTAATAAAA